MQAVESVPMAASRLLVLAQNAVRSVADAIRSHYFDNRIRRLGGRKMFFFLRFCMGVVLTCARVWVVSYVLGSRSTLQ